MKILCLHGAYGSATNFKVQLAPFIAEVEKSDDVEFLWVDGAHPAIPPPHYEAYFGAPPLYRNIAFDGVGQLDDVLTRVRDLAPAESPEETIRQFLSQGATYGAPAFLATLDRMIKLLDRYPDIDGIMGYSEGATVAASLLLEERRRFERDGRPIHLKCGIFFSGWPAVAVEGDDIRILLADECDVVLDMPTCHIVGCKDPYIDGAMALYSLCDEDKAILFDHGQGHLVPRDHRTVEELATGIRDTISKAMQSG